MRYRIDYERPLYILKEKCNFLFITYWKTIECSARYDIVEKIYSNLNRTPND